jgi:hypothetical protein
MKPELAEKILALIEARVHSLPTSMEFEMAYQARVAIDRIRFAIKHTEQFAPRTDQMRHVGVQLLDALQRLEAVDRRFQSRCRMPLGKDVCYSHGGREALLKTETGSLQLANGCHGMEARHPERSD